MTSRIARQVSRRQGQVDKITALTGAGYGSAMLAGLAAGSPQLTYAALGGAAVHAGIRLQEARNWHRRGGKAAARKRRRHQGHASRREMNRKVSLAAARRSTAVMRPSLGGRTRGLPARDAGVFIGSSRGIDAYGGWRDSYAAFGPPGSGKTTWMASTGLKLPGAALFTSTRADMAAHTAAARARTGPVWFINPSRDGGFPSSLSWSPLDGCEDPRMAMDAAGAMMHAAPRDPGGKDAYWDHQSKVYLQLLLHAAALTPGASILTVRSWALNPAALGAPLDVLAAAGAPGWADELAGMMEQAAADEKYATGVTGGTVSALAWLSDPELAAAACPREGEGFSPRHCIRSRGTVYLIGADTPHNPLSPYFACFTTRLWNEAKRMAADPGEAASSGLRLDPPLGLVLDEPAITCPVPIDRWSAEAGGHGIVLVTGFQSASQLPQRWGEHGGNVLMDNITVKIIFGGITGALLKTASSWGGVTDTWDWVQGPGGRTRQPRQEPAFPEERLRQLDLGEAFVVHRNTRPFITRLGRVEDDPAYERADPADFTSFRAGPLAITAGTRAAAELPGTVPAPAVPLIPRTPEEAHT